MKICHSFGVGKSICENGIWLAKLVIWINICKMKFKKYEIKCANGLHVIKNIIKTRPVIKLIPKILVANRLEIKKVSDIVLK